MIKKAQSIDMKQLARIGAAARVAELEQEIRALKRAFPGLRVLSVDVVEAPDASAAAGEKVARRVAARRGRRTPMTSAERKVVSERMKKYWDERRKQKG